MSTKKPGAIINREMVGRKGNSEIYEPRFKELLHAGTEFNLIENRGVWYHVGWRIRGYAACHRWILTR